jgi:hypothetical protein
MLERLFPVLAGDIDCSRGSIFDHVAAMEAHDRGAFYTLAGSNVSGGSGAGDLPEIILDALDSARSAKEFSKRVLMNCRTRWCPHAPATEAPAVAASRDLIDVLRPELDELTATWAVYCGSDLGEVERRRVTAELRRLLCDISVTWLRHELRPVFRWIVGRAGAHASRGLRALVWVHHLFAGDGLALGSARCRPCDSLGQLADAHAVSARRLRQLNEELARVSAQTPIAKFPGIDRA